MSQVDAQQLETYRRILGLPASGATTDEVRRCHRREIRRWHPDVAGGSEQRARLLNQARDHLLRYPEDIRAMPATPPPPVPEPQRIRTEVGKGATASAGSVLVGLGAVVRFICMAYVVVLGLAILGWIVTAILGI